MKLTYETGIATLIQFIVLSFFTLGSQVVSVVTTCHNDGGNCIGNLLTSIIFYILVAMVFGSIWIIGVGAQERRGKRLAQLLVSIEGLVALGALFSLKLSLHNKSIFALIASFLIFALAIWIITLAWRIMRSGGNRISRGSGRGGRSRQRKHSIS